MSRLTSTGFKSDFMLYSGKSDNINVLFSGVHVVKVAEAVFMFGDFNLNIGTEAFHVENPVQEIRLGRIELGRPNGGRLEFDMEHWRPPFPAVIRAGN